MGFPHFDYMDMPMAHMAYFKTKCAVGLWKASLTKDSEKLVGIAKKSCRFLITFQTP